MIIGGEEQVRKSTANKRLSMLKLKSFAELRKKGKSGGGGKGGGEPASQLKDQTHLGTRKSETDPEAAETFEPETDDDASVPPHLQVQT